MFFLRPAGTQFIDRGALAAVDYEIGSFTADGDYHDLDISSFVGATKRLVMIGVEMAAVEPNRSLFLATGGYTTFGNIDSLWTQVLGTPVHKTFWIMTDDSGIIQYNLVVATWAFLNMTIRGYFKG